VCLYVSPPILASQRLGKHVTAETNTPTKNKRTMCRFLRGRCRIKQM
jgi:hypothetical protein